MTILFPLSAKQIFGDVILVAIVALVALAWVLPQIPSLYPYAQLFIVAWVWWRFHDATTHLLARHTWATPQNHTWIPTEPLASGIMLGNGFKWTGKHMAAIHAYTDQFDSLPVDNGVRGGSPAIHGCGSNADVPIILPWGRLASHVAIEGSTRCGKTNLLGVCIQQTIAKGDGAVVIIDPKGSDDLYQVATQTAKQYGRTFALIRPRTPELSERFNILSSCEQPTDLPGRLRPLFPKDDKAYFKDAPLSLIQLVAGMHRTLEIPWDIRTLHRDTMDLDALRFTLARYLSSKGTGLHGVRKEEVPDLAKLKDAYQALGSDDPLVPGVMRALERTQEAHQDRFGNLDVALSGISDVEHADLFGAEDSLTWDEIDHGQMVVLLRTDSLVTRQIGRNIGSLFFQDFMGYMGLRYLTQGTRRVPITVFIDELREVVYQDFLDGINKVGEAGGRLFLCWQSDADLDAALTRDEAQVIRANCQTRITMRIADTGIADDMARKAPMVRVKRSTSSRAMLMAGHGGKGITVENEEISLIDANLLFSQPVGQCFARLDGSLYHINIPTHKESFYEEPNPPSVPVFPHCVRL